MLLPNRIEIKIISQSLQSNNPALGVALLNEYSMPAGLRAALLSKLTVSNCQLVPTELLNGLRSAESSKETQQKIKSLPAMTVVKSRPVPTRFLISQSAKVRLENRRRTANAK